MTGYSYQRCKDLYFNRGPLSKLSNQNRRSLLQSLHTYITLIGVLAPNDTNTLNEGLKKMVQEVASAKLDTKSLESSQFENWHNSVEGALRAKLPSAYHAAGFAQIVYSLGHLDSATGATHLLKHDLFHWLLKLRKSISDEAFEVVDKDRIRLLKELKGIESKPDEVSKKLANNMMALQDEWGGLILGNSSAIDLLDNKEKLALWGMAALVGVGIGLGIAALVLVPFVVVSWVAKVNTTNLTLDIASNFFSTVQTFIAILTAVGISLGFLVKKAFDAFRASVSFLSVFLAGHRSLRSKDSPINE